MADKKPKVGDAVGWVVVDSDFNIRAHNQSRDEARNELYRFKIKGGGSPYRIAKIVLSK